ncbi:MAG: aminoacyl-tRNA hydrolase, partial [Chloroflexi bacterium]|nr:aminoacyl-tRNA hydrolase [Chloroflexota bacterium]
MIRVTDTLWLGESEVEFSFFTSSGPGGQHVNKVATAVQLRFDAARSPAVRDDVRARLRSLAGRRMTSDGVVII